MPKLHKDLDTTLNFGVKLELKQNLIAIGYFLGGKGEYANPARDFVQSAYRIWLAGLSDKDRKDFDSILANVKISVTK